MTPSFSDSVDVERAIDGRLGPISIDLVYQQRDLLLL
jgi:hypothetical protein